MLAVLPRLLLVITLSTTFSATLSCSWAAQAADSPPLPNGAQKVQTKNAATHHAPRVRSATHKPVNTPVQVVKVAAPDARAQAPAQPSASAAAASEPAPPPSPEPRWQAPLAAAALMLVIALKRQGSHS